MKTKQSGTATHHDVKNTQTKTNITVGHLNSCMANISSSYIYIFLSTTAGRQYYQTVVELISINFVEFPKFKPCLLNCVGFVIEINLKKIVPSNQHFLLLP